MFTLLISMINRNLINIPYSKELRDDMVATLKESRKDIDLTTKLRIMIKSKCPIYKYINFITNQNNIAQIPFQQCKANKNLKNTRNFRIPIKIAPIQKPKERSHDVAKFSIVREKTCVEEFCSQLSNFTRPLDVICAALRLNKISIDEARQLVDRLDYRIPEPIPLTFSFISNSLANGVLDKETHQSYTKKLYPLGIPSCTGCEPEVNKLLNNNYVAVEQRTSANGRPHIIQQVSNELEGVEDTHAATDVEIALNENVRRHILEYGWGYILTASDTGDELTACFGKNGRLLLKLMKLYYDQISAPILDMLQQRAINLGVRRLQFKPNWSKTLEKKLPPTRAQYKKPTKQNTDFSYLDYGMPPIDYDIQNVNYLSEIMEKYYAKRAADNKQAIDIEIEYWRRSIQFAIKILRTEQITDEFTANYGLAALLTASAMLASSLKVVRELDDAVDKSRKIPIEIGLTDHSMGGHDRVFDMAIDIITNKKKKKKDELQEMAGCFKTVDINGCLHLIHIITLTIKTMKYHAANSNSESPIARIYIGNGRLNMAPLYGPIGSVAINLEIFRPKESFI
ncbi:hypothetical protein TVAG_402740 [Trichomonas vaginalis G3]|uniref:Uncharacterized protein n=1 Tax=Trichomonas vaginalis (strain ATCC PRA-98 / G3) TaxID=412133 RepID=A2DI29_TRIV3|nr:zinc ion binding [Trichomonas vaginalis G3]EAY20018.1 hypothetical protein TVAG_402740 [Trichomonas vaginalis G3]KAI5525969.1 zinc ion binding [Trichomonas vaginalis G3]|eukprot:XP_001581004.1 hypothetical protein [Trichomonas vaginalis G3]